jgi:hypothetical protein
MRERLGQLVRDEWLAWARKQPNPKPAWLLLWEELSEASREVDRQIGERLFGLGLSSAQAVCRQRSENEDVYSGKRSATCDRLIEEIEVFRVDGRLYPIGGAYAGSGKTVTNPLTEPTKEENSDEADQDDRHR